MKCIELWLLLGGKVIKEELINYKGKVIGFSATPIRGDGLNSVQKLFNGEQISELSLVEAILNGLLPQPTYVTGIYEVQDKDIKNIVKNETLAKQFYDYDLNNNLEFIFKKYLDLTPNKCLHIIVFCHRISDIKKAKDNMEKWIDIRPVKHYEVHSDKHKEENQKAIKEFESATTGLNIIYSANMLNEGIHPKKLDAVVFLRKTKSNVVYKQQLGRVISEYLDNSIVFDLVNNIYNIETGYMKEFKDYAKVHNIKYKDIKTKFNEPLKIYEEQKDLIKLISSTHLRKYTEEENKFIVQYVLNNYKTKTIRQISRELSVDVNKIISIYHKFNLKSIVIVVPLNEEEKQYILNNYKSKSIRQIAKYLNRRDGTILNFMHRYNLNFKRKRIDLTEEEKQYILNNYKTKTMKQIAKDLNRQHSSIILNYVHKNNLIPIKNHKLTEEEKQYILNNYKSKSITQIAKDLNRSTTVISRFYKNHNLEILFNTGRILNTEKISIVQYVLNNYKTKTRKQMAKEMNVSDTYIRNICKEYSLDKHVNLSITEEEKQYILNNYKSKSAYQIAKDLNRSTAFINTFYKNHNLKFKYKRIDLTEEEKQYILNNYKTKTKNQISKDLNRSLNAITNYLNKVNLTIKTNRINQDELVYMEQYVLNNYKTKTKNQISKDLNRSTSVISKIYKKFNLKAQFGSKGCSKLTEEEKQYVLNNYKTKTKNQISKDLNRSDTTIDKFCKTNNIICKSISLSEEEKQYILNNYKTKDITSLAKHLNRSWVTISNFIKQ